MREIKFRFWDILNNEMFSEIIVEPFDRGTKSNEKEVWLNAAIKSMKSFKMMQYTGLKDKNGKEIYESDIVRTSLYGERDCEIVFRKAGFYLLVNIDIGLENILYEPSEVTMEIIGNIYENPELLSTTNQEE